MTNSLANGCAWVGGRYVPAREASVPILDWGFLHSDATYDVVTVWDGAYFRLNDHLDRFERSMAKLRLDVKLSRDEMTDILDQCVIKAGLRHAYVEMIATRGPAAPGSRDPRSCANTFFAFAIPFVWIADETRRARGLDARISSIHRIDPAAVDPTVKNYHWLDMTMALFEAYDHGQETTILTDAAGNVVEGPGFNVFALTGSTLATPKAGVLRGISRMTVMDLARDMGLTVEERLVQAEEARAADEVFITSSGGGVLPVSRLDGVPVGAGVPGPVTSKLVAAYWAAHDDPGLSRPVPYP